MFEIDDPARRASVLARLGGIEHHVFLDIAGERIRGEPDPTRENTSPEGKPHPSNSSDFRSPATRSPASEPPGRRWLPVSIIRITGIWRCCRSRSAPLWPRISIEIRS
jgi:hypothetical protein